MKAIPVILLLILLVGFFGCTQKPPEEEPETGDESGEESPEELEEPPAAVDEKAAFEELEKELENLEDIDAGELESALIE